MREKCDFGTEFALQQEKKGKHTYIGRCQRDVLCRTGGTGEMWNRSSEWTEQKVVEGDERRKKEDDL